MQAAAGVPPAIKEPKPAGANKGLVDCLADIPRGCYADVIVQFVCSIESERTPGMPCLLVWDGSEWPHKALPLSTVEFDDRPERHLSDPALKEKAKGRMVTIFSYDFDNQCKRPIESGDWLYLENVHCAYQRDSASSSLVMHDNIRPRHIWRLELPVSNRLFYAETLLKSMQRVKDVQPLPEPAVEEQRRLAQPQPQQAAAPAARAASASISPQRTPSLAALGRLQTMILDEMLREGIRMPSSDDTLARAAKSVVATFKAEAAAAPAAAATAQPAAAPAAAAPVAADPNRAAPAAAPAAAVAPKQEAAASVQRAAAAPAAAQATTSPKRAAASKFAVPTVPNRPPPTTAAPAAAPTAASTVTSPTRAARKDAAAAAAAPTGAKSPKRAAPKEAAPAGAPAVPTVDSRAAAAASANPAAAATSVTSPKRAAAPKPTALAAVAARAAKLALQPPADSTAASRLEQKMRQRHCPKSQEVETDAAAPTVTSPKRAAASKSAADAAPAAVPPRAAKVALQPPADSTAASRLEQKMRQKHCPKSQEVETDAAETAVAGPTTRAAAATTNDAAGQSPTRKSPRKRSAPITHQEETGAPPPKRSRRKSNDSHNSTIVIDDSSDEEEEVREKKPQVGAKKAGDGRTTVTSKSASPEKKPVLRKPNIRAGTPPPGARNSSRPRPKAELTKN